MKSNYSLVETTKSRCPQCDEYLVLLYTDAGNKPLFFICFKDEVVVEAGRGRCPKSAELQVSDRKDNLRDRARLERKLVTP